MQLRNHTYTSSISWWSNRFVLWKHALSNNISASKSKTLQRNHFEVEAFVVGKISLMLNQCYLPVISPLQSQLLSGNRQKAWTHFQASFGCWCALGKPSQSLTSAVPRNWCDNNKVHSKCAWIIPKPFPPRSMEKLSSTKPAPGAKKMGDFCFASFLGPFLYDFQMPPPPPTSVSSSRTCFISVTLL